MTDVKAKINSISYSESGEMLVTFACDRLCKADIDKYRDKTIKLVIGNYTAHRSLSANAYAWVLISKLAKALGESKEQVYRELIRSVDDASETILVADKQLRKFVKEWQSHGLGWQVEFYESKFTGYTVCKLYAGSSEFDAAQMMQFLNIIKQECIAQDIPVETPGEIARMVSLWASERNRQ